ncbi:MAG TPA: hypothetical protein VG890_16505 [Puia sp.]|nr:hypothetical protein [Puia sp.]
MKANGKDRKLRRKNPQRRNQSNPSVPHTIQSHNFSDVEDNRKAFDIIRDIVVSAGNNAAIEAKVAGLYRVYIRNHRKFIALSPTGSETELQPRIRRSSYYIQYKPNTVLHAVSK